MRPIWREPNPKTQETPNGWATAFPRQERKECTNFLITKANTQERVGRPPVSLTIVGFICLNSYNLHETTNILIDEKEEANLSREVLEGQEK